MTHETHGIVAVIIRENENNIPRLGSLDLLCNDRIWYGDHLRRKRDAQGDAGSKAKDLGGEYVHDKTRFLVSILPVAVCFKLFPYMAGDEEEPARIAAQ
jgi:hypothetical protein